MSRDELEQLTQSVSDIIADSFGTHDSHCYLGALLVQRELERRHVPARVVWGYYNTAECIEEECSGPYHAWTVVDDTGLLCDPTRSQFEEGALVEDRRSRHYSEFGSNPVKEIREYGHAVALQRVFAELTAVERQMLGNGLVVHLGWPADEVIALTNGISQSDAA